LLSQQAYDAMLGSFASDLGKHVQLIDVGGDTVEDAIAAARNYARRAPDAIHLASASAAERRSQGGDFIIVTSDKELLAASNAAGMATLDPELGTFRHG